MQKKKKKDIYISWASCDNDVFTSQSPVKNMWKQSGSV